MTYKAKKLFNGFVSVRDYIVKKCLAVGCDLKVVYHGETMVVPFERLKNPLKLVKRPMKSKFGGSYYLYDFKWDVSKERMISGNLQLF